MNIYDCAFCGIVLFASYLLFRSDPAASEEHASETLHRAYDKDGNFLGYVTEAGMDLINECQTQLDTCQN